MEKRNSIIVKGVIFDFDKTLFQLQIDWEDLKGTLARKTARLGYIKSFTPLYENLFEVLKLVEKDTNATNASRIRQECYNLITNWEMRGIRKGHIISFADIVLRILRENKISVGIVSSNSRKVVKRVCKENNWYPNVIIGREDTITMKPNSEPVALCTKKMRLDSRSVVGVGDKQEDIQAYKSANLLSSFLLTSDKTTFGKNSIIIIKSLDELFLWIKIR